MCACASVCACEVDFAISVAIIAMIVLVVVIKLFGSSSSSRSRDSRGGFILNHCWHGLPAPSAREPPSCPFGCATERVPCAYR